MLPIRWRTEAQAYLSAILTYIAERNQQAATRLYDDKDRGKFIKMANVILFNAAGTRPAARL